MQQHSFIYVNGQNTDNYARLMSIKYSVKDIVNNGTATSN